MQYHAVRAVQYSAVQCSIVQYYIVENCEVEIILHNKEATELKLIGTRTRTCNRQVSTTIYDKKSIMEK